MRVREEFNLKIILSKKWNKLIVVKISSSQFLPDFIDTTAF